MDDYEFISLCEAKVLNGEKITNEEASMLMNINDDLLSTLSDSANRITRKFHGTKIDIEQLTNIKKNQCSENCSFCSQSAFFDTDVNSHDLLSEEEIMKQAKKSI